MPRYYRKSTPRVADGVVQRKNRWRDEPDYAHTLQVRIERRAASTGFVHLVSPADIESFIHLLPDWDSLAIGLQRIILDSDNWDCLGWHRPGIVAIGAWDDEIVVTMCHSFYEDHREVLQRLGVPCRPASAGEYVAEHTPATARAFQLLHVLLHELGHHHDRMTSRTKRRCTRGEPYAESYALRHEAIIWRKYLATFGL